MNEETLVELSYFLLAIAAFFLFVYWRPKRKKFKRREGLYFKSPHGDIFYRVHGDKGHPILLIHGLGASSYSWRHLIPLLEKKHRIVSLDLWGFGKSHKDPSVFLTIDDHCDIINQLLKTLKIKKCHLVGSSMGGAIAFWLALQNKERFKKIVGFAPAAHPSLVPEYLTKLSWVAGWTPWVMNRTLIKQALWGIYNNKSLVTEEAIDAYLEPYLDRRAHRTFANALSIIQDERIFNSLPRITNDTLIIWGEKDSTIPKTIIDKVVEKHPNTLYISHPSAGHHPMEEYPQWSAEKVLEFLDQSSF